MFYHSLDQLKESDNNYIIGAGLYASNLYSCLVASGITISGFLLDKKYWRENMLFCGKKVYLYDDFCNSKHSYNIVIGFQNVARTKALIQQYQDNKSGKDVYLLWGFEKHFNMTPTWVEKNRRVLDEISSVLCDDLSKRTLQLFLDSSITGDYSGMMKVAEDHQYFNALTLENDFDNRVYIDCGAFDGATVKQYIDFVEGNYRRIFLFEPSEKNLQIMNENLRSVTNLVVVDKAAWSTRTVLYFNENGSESTVNEEGDGASVETIPIDDVVKEEVVSFIKMDIEGSELQALIGARKTIARCLPKLAICCYHKKEDIIDFYLFLKEFIDAGKYNLYLRHHSNYESETVLYAIPVLL